ncbi:MAG: homoserine O-acetyltransferase MetX, partial [Phycisphaeraceae bacterium]
PNVLGGCSGTTGPNSTNPQTGQPYGRDFPSITIADMVHVQRHLIDHLGVEKLLAVIGGSLGGMQALTWTIRYPDRVAGCAAIATSPRLTSQAIAFDIVGRNAILSDPHFQDGHYYEAEHGPDHGLAIARMLGHITYLSREAMTDKFEADRFQPHDVPTDFEKKFSVGSYLAHQGNKFVERFDANSYLRLSLAMDLFDLGGTHEQLSETFGVTRCRWLVVSFSSDWLFPSFQSRQMVSALIAGDKPVSYCEVTSNAGHDAFLLRDDFDRYGEMVRGFLDNLLEPNRESHTEHVDESDHHHPTSIYHARRLDYDLILDLIARGSSVLDLGCGQGGLLSRLKREKHDRVMGVELDEHAIVTSVHRGLDVVQHDLNRGLLPFKDGQFDYVVLSQALQAVSNVETAMDEMLRVGKRCIVSFPNVGYAPLRRRLNEHGHAPVPAADREYAWYNTPNIRFCSIADFDDFCLSREIQVHRALHLDTAAGRQVMENPNLNADIAIYVLSR